MKKRPNLVLREPVKLYETSGKIKEVRSEAEDKSIAEIESPQIKEREDVRPQTQPKESVKARMPPRIGQIWDYFCRKAKENGEINPIFSLTRSEVMKEAGIGSTNTYRDALKRFQDMGLLEIELRPGVNSGSIFTLTEKGIEQID